MKRKRPNLREQLAAALLELKVADAAGQLAPVIDRDEAKTMDANEIIARFELDHWPIPAALGGGNHPTNLMWREKGEHREKTAKRDIPEIAKGKRLSRSEEEFRRRMLAKAGTPAPDDAAGEGGAARPKRQWPSRPFARRKVKA